MNFYDMTAAVPISSLFNVMTIDNNLFSSLIGFYQEVMSWQIYIFLSPLSLFFL